MAVSVSSPVRRYSPWLGTATGTSGTGLDQLIGWLRRDPGLSGSTEAASLPLGIAAANALNELIAQGLAATGNANTLVLTAADLVALNQWLRADSTRLAAFITAHGDDAGGVETGFHRLAGNGASQVYRGANLVDGLLDAIYHVGFPINAAGQFENEDGAANEAVASVARWLSALRVDAATTGGELDRLPEAVLADGGLANSIGLAQIKAGAEAANGLNQMILQGLAALPAGSGTNPRRIEVSEVVALNAWIRSDPSRFNTFVALHGDDVGGVATGFHLVQNDGSNTQQFGLNLVDTVLDGIFHIGFLIGADGRFQNEDGNANALVTDVADWLDYYLGDPSTTGTGLDRIVDAARWDAGLAANTTAADIRGGLTAANNLNLLILEAVAATSVNLDGWISRADLRTLSRWVQVNRYAQFLADHGNDEAGVETGFHLIQGDGGNIRVQGENLIDTVADGIYHIGFAIQTDYFLNEDGNQNAALGDVSSWLNYYLNNRAQVLGDTADDVLIGTDLAEQIVARGGADLLEGWGGSDLLDGSWGDDTLLGGPGADQLDGSYGGDWLDGGEDSDLYLVIGNQAGGWQSFNGHDVYADAGLLGTDRIVASGDGDVDIGLRGFSPSSGIEEIDATGATGRVRLVGDWGADVFDFSATRLIGANLRIDGFYGEDLIVGSNAADTIHGGGSDDWLDGGDGGDTFTVTGTFAGGWEFFSGFDVFADSGSSGIDRILAVGPGPVDIGLTGFGPETGIERIEAAAGTGVVRLLGRDDGQVLDFSATTLVGANLRIDGAYGEDTILGSATADTIIGGGGDDWLDGGPAADTYLVSGTYAAGWSLFAGYDTYADSGAGTTAGLDRILAVGPGPVDIGLLGFGPESGIERIEAGSASPVRLLGTDGVETLDFSRTTLVGTAISIDGAYGDDVIIGSTAADTLSGGGGDDRLNGGNGGDTYLVSGNEPGGWAVFSGYDTYADSGTTGTDRILAVGPGDVDIGLAGFSATNGIERIEAAAGTGLVRLLGGWASDSLDFSRATLVGANLRIDGGFGNDTVSGSAAADSIVGGGGDDRLNGGGGGDTYLVSGNEPGGWAVFSGYDTYADSGTAGTDRILAVGPGDVDIGLAGFSATNGIERIEAAAGTGRVRLLGGWGADTLNFSRVTVVADQQLIDGFHGNDSITGTAGADTIQGGGGDDRVNGGNGGDTYLVSGTEAGGWEQFGGHDSYADTGTTGIDRILAVGPGDVDIGLRSFGATNGIERIEAAPGTGQLRLLGYWGTDIFDFSRITVVAADVRVETGGGKDTINGSAGDDRIDAGSDLDRLIGGAGADILTGGSERDTFVFSSAAHIGLTAGRHDVITDFLSGTDLMDLAAVDANTLLAGDQAFRYVGAAAFSGIAGELRLADQVLTADLNGDRLADVWLGLPGVTALNPITDLRL